MSGELAAEGTRRVEAAVARRAFGQVWIGASGWAVAFGVTAAASALTYVSTFPTEASRQQIAATTGRDVGLAVLLGPVSAVGTVGGYTVYKGFVFLTTIGAIWAILAATRLLRGEEEAGRWQLVLAGDTNAWRATAATMIALGAAISVIFGGTTLIVWLAGRNPKVGFGIGETMLYASSITIIPAVFMAVGGLTSQLGRTRRLATGLGMSVFAFTFVLRMIADSGPHTRWLLWLTPFGWTELMRPFTGNDLWPLLPAAGTALGLGVATTVVAARRDVGDGLLTTAEVSPLRPFGLGSPSGLVLRLELPTLASWCAGAVASAFTLGLIAKVATGTVPTSLGNTLGKFGVHGRFINQYLGVAFLLIATVIALLPAGQIGAASEEETSGRLVHLLSRPTSRGALLGGRLALSGAGVGLAGVLAGLAGWLGARTQGIDLGLGTMVDSGLNVVPSALVALGVGAVVLSVAPRLAVRAVYATVIGSFIMDLLAPMVSGLGWLDRFSLFHYMALVPAQRAHVPAIVLTVALAVILDLAAILIFARRDLQPA
jgi:ABC-2 type transport system permease protein